jgi:hypothetical protein
VATEAHYENASSRPLVIRQPLISSENQHIATLNRYQQRDRRRCFSVSGRDIHPFCHIDLSRVHPFFEKSCHDLPLGVKYLLDGKFFKR